MMKRSICLSLSGLGLLAAGAALGLRGVTAHRPVTLPDVPLGSSKAIRLPNGWQVTPAGRPPNMDLVSAATLLMVITKPAQTSPVASTPTRSRSRS